MSRACGTTQTVSESYSLYLHIPFCKVRCAYCDFNTYAGLDDQIAPYVRALVAEVRADAL